jgi:hypothetical protein
LVDIYPLFGCGWKIDGGSGMITTGYDSEDKGEKRMLETCKQKGNIKENKGVKLIRNKT